MWPRTSVRLGLVALMATMVALSGVTAGAALLGTGSGGSSDAPQQQEEPTTEPDETTVAENETTDDENNETAANETDDNETVADGVEDNETTPDGPVTDNQTVADNETVDETPDEAEVAPADTPENESFEVSAVVAPSNVSGIEFVVVTANVSNPNDEPVTQTVELRFDGETVTRQAVSLASGESRMVALPMDADGVDAGDHTVAVFTRDDGEFAELTVQETASFDVDDLEAPSTVTAGDNVTVNASIENENNESDTQNVTFRLEGEVVERLSVTLDANESTDVSFDVGTEGLDEGEYRHGVFSRDDGEIDTLTVEEAPENETAENETVEETTTVTETTPEVTTTTPEVTTTTPEVTTTTPEATTTTPEVTTTTPEVTTTPEAAEETTTPNETTTPDETVVDGDT